MLAGFKARWTMFFACAALRPSADVDGDLDGAFGGEIPRCDQIAELDTFDELHRDQGEAIRFVDLVHGGDIGMIEHCGRFRLANETLAPVGRFNRIRADDFDGDVAAELVVVGTVDFTHPAFTNRREDLEMAELRAGSQRHDLDGDSIDSGNGCRTGESSG